MNFFHDEYNYVGKNFTIEKNIIKGAEKGIDLSVHIGKVVLEQLSKDPDHVVQVDADTGQRTIRAEMKENIIRCAVWLQKQCINKNDVITVCTHNNLDAYIPCFATFLVGAIFNPWHYEDTLKMACHYMNLTKPKIIFVCESASKTLVEAARLENHDPLFVVIGKDQQFSSLNDIMGLQVNDEVEKFQLGVPRDRRDPAMILFSSGSTGMPKGVTLPYETLCGWFRANPMSMKNSAILWYSPLYWLSGVLYMIQALMNSATRIIHANSDPDEICKVIDKFKVSSLLFSSSLTTRFAKSNAFKKYSLESVKLIMTGGAKISHKILQDLKNCLPHIRILQAYGTTEIGGAISVQTNDCKNVKSVGFVVPNLLLKVVDIDTGRPLGPNQPGECCLKSPMGMIDYYKNPLATKSTIDEEGWIHSGDKVYYTEEGEIIVIDRIKEVMKFRGHHVSPSELEDVLLKHPGVMDAAVVPIPDDVDLELPMAFVKKIPGVEVSEEELVKMTSELGEYKTLRGGVKFLEKLPYTASGKLKRKDLKEMAKALSNFKIKS